MSNFEDLGKEMSMFASSTATPQLVIIGQNSKVAFSKYGYMTEEDIRIEIDKALAGLSDLKQVEKLNSIFLETGKISIDLSQKFTSLNGSSIVYSVDSISDSSIVNAEVGSNELVLTRGVNTGICTITVLAETSLPQTVYATFKVMVYPAGSQIVGFEDSESWIDHFYYLGDEKWGRDGTAVFNEGYSLKSGSIPTPDYEGGVSYSTARIEFYSEKDDTLAFAYKISSQFDSDGFELYIDDAEVDLPDAKWSGEIDWTFAEYFIKPGNHRIDWRYYKFEYGFAGKDAAWLDIIKVPGSLSGIENENVQNEPDLISNYPNPFNSSTTLKFKLDSGSIPSLTVFNIKGEIVIEKILGKMNKGINNYDLDLSGLESGSFFYRLKTQNHLFHGKMLYLK